jgi:hypothetical protein
MLAGAVLAAQVGSGLLRVEQLARRLARVGRSSQVPDGERCAERTGCVSRGGRQYAARRQAAAGRRLVVDLDPSQRADDLLSGSAVASEIRSLVLRVDLVGSRPVWPAQVGCLVGPDGSSRVASDRLDDQPDDQAMRRGALGHPDDGRHCGAVTRYSIW